MRSNHGGVPAGAAHLGCRSADRRARTALWRCPGLRSQSRRPRPRRGRWWAIDRARPARGLIQSVERDAGQPSDRVFRGDRCSDRFSTRRRGCWSEFARPPSVVHGPFVPAWSRSTRLSCAAVLVMRPGSPTRRWGWRPWAEWGGRSAIARPLSVNLRAHAWRSRSAGVGDATLAPQRGGGGVGGIHGNCRWRWLLNAAVGVVSIRAALVCLGLVMRRWLFNAAARVSVVDWMGQWA